MLEVLTTITKREQFLNQKRKPNISPLLISKFNPDYALELRYEVLNSNKSGSFIGFSIAPLWLNQKTQRSDRFEAV